MSFSTDLGNSHSVKFYIRDLDTSAKVYLQNTKKHQLHFDFAQEVLGIPGTADQFAADTYTGKDRRAMAGTLIFYPSVSGSAQGATPNVGAPWTINFLPGDPVTPDQVRLAHRLIEERITCLQWAGPERRLVYVPAAAAREGEARSDARGFERVGIGWMSHEDLYGAIAIQTLNPGVAFGTLKRMTSEELARTVVSSRDVLLLTRVPNELPVVGGTITEELQTPLAHVNVAARTRGTPNLAYPEASRDPVIAPLIGKLVRFEVNDGGYSLRQATLVEAEAFWNGRTRERTVPGFDLSLTGVPSFDEIGFADSARVGVKAANLAELSNLLGENAPRKGLAVPFVHYDSFMSAGRSSAALCDGAKAACASGGRDGSACERARVLCLPPSGEPETFNALLDRVLEDPSFKQDTVLRDAVLDSVRYLIVHTPVDPAFGDLLDARIAELFGTAKVKIRSSTNSEDLPGFSGAGLYDSVGAYAAGKDAGSKVVAKVFASVWGFRAFEERAFWNIDHRAVRMGCAINQAFTDELANGVLITENVGDPGVYGMYVNVQKGEEEVTNPTGGALPEIFSILADTGYDVARLRFSSLSPGLPLLSAQEVASLYQAGDKARTHFSRLYGRHVILDIEFKLTPEHTIVFKQARPYTVPAS
jgi:pyruvate, water dikinase